MILIAQGLTAKWAYDNPRVLEPLVPLVDDRYEAAHRLWMLFNQLDDFLIGHVDHPFRAGASAKQSDINATLPEISPAYSFAEPAGASLLCSQISRRAYRSAISQTSHLLCAIRADSFCPLQTVHFMTALTSSGRGVCWLLRFTQHLFVRAVYIPILGRAG